ncbi:MAG TPA: DUF2520 domain-containing protein [Bdellovibrio sp.]|nr:DUF2520 domain-containing protein [Bdellovibrio sp.]
MATTKNFSSFSYLLIGSGRVARHLSHYFNLLNIHHQTWDRAQDPHALRQKINVSSHILLAISDGALSSFFQKHLEGLDKTVVHFSGALHLPGMIAAHPLMTFGPELYEMNFYRKIHFTMTGASLAEALPGLDNPFSILPVEQKSLYHAYCVVGGNFSSLLVAKMLEGFAEMKIPSSAAKIYIEKVIENTFSQPDKAATGPLIRKDAETVAANLSALENSPTQNIYKAFVEAYWPEYPRK